MKPKSAKPPLSLGKSEVLPNPKRRGRPPGKTGKREDARAKLIGKTFGELTILKAFSGGACVASCTCGGTWRGSWNNLKKGTTVTCGCRQNRVREQNTKDNQRFVGQVFGRLTITKIHDKSIFEALCVCGNVWIGKKHTLLYGETTSCGCFHKEVVGKLNLSHGHTKGLRPTKVYRAWRSMHRRCYEHTEKNKHYKRKGIQVCRRWRVGDSQKSGFEYFLADMGNPPSKDHSIDRIDNDGHYRPGNVRWATIKQQANNRDNNRRVKAFGKTKNLSQWSEDFQREARLVQSRLAAGWNAEEAITKPTRKLIKDRCLNTH